MKEEKDKEAKIKLIFLNFLSNFKADLEKACEIFSIATSTGYSWIRQWNEEGYEGIKDKGNKGGKPPKFSDEDLEKLKEILKDKEYWITKEVRRLIKEKFGIEFSD